MHTTMATFNGVCDAFVSKFGRFWRRLNNATPEHLAVGDLDGGGKQDVIGDFGTTGLWAYDNDSAWRKINGKDASALACGDLNGDGFSGAIGAFAGAGLWIYD